MAERDERHEIKGYERVFNVIGWIGMLTMVPVALKVFNHPQFSNFLVAHLGKYGSTGFLLLIFFVLILLRVVFGSGRIITPLIISSLSAFVFISTAAGVGFMEWLRKLVEGSKYFGNMPLNFLTGIAVVIIGILLSYLRRFPIFMQIVILVVLPVAFLVVAGITGFLSGLSGIKIQ